MIVASLTLSGVCILRAQDQVGDPGSGGRRSLAGVSCLLVIKVNYQEVRRGETFECSHRSDCHRCKTCEGLGARILRSLESRDLSQLLTIRWG